MKLGLIGKDISHSLSPKIYSELIKDYFSYDLIDHDSEDSLPTLKQLQEDGYSGINITSPYKKSYLNIASEGKLTLTDTALKLNAINCLKITSDIIYATNTDYIAIETLHSSLEKFEDIILLGNGVMASLFV